jgi:hypothetical protein
MAYKTFAEPSASMGPNLIKKFLKDTFACYVTQGYLSSLSILLFHIIECIKQLFCMKIKTRRRKEE